MNSFIEDIFQSIQPPMGGSHDKPLYSVLPVPDYEKYFIGKDSDLHAYLLVSTPDGTFERHPPIRLASLDIQFDLQCRIREGKNHQREGRFTVIQCRSLNTEFIHYFLSICETIVRVVGNNPTCSQVAAAVNRLALIFQKLQRPPTRSVNGLFGELYFISRSRNPIRSLSAWRVDEKSRFDFADGNIRLDVKTSGGRQRIHKFSYDQCNPPSGTIPVVASLLVEQIAGGKSIRTLINEIERRIASQPNLLLKLYDVITETLGNSFEEAMSIKYDMRLADSSLRFFNLQTIPAIRGPLPVGISDVHFCSDLSTIPFLSTLELIEKDSIFGELLPPP